MSQPNERPLEVGEMVYRLNQNGQPMMTSTGLSKIVGRVEAVGDLLVRVKWLSRGWADPAETLDPPANLRRR